MPSIDPYSDAVVSLEILFGDTRFGHATGSFWRANGDIFLVTNWHVVTGRNFETGEHVLSHAGEPNALGLVLPDNDGTTHDIRVSLYDEGRPTWFVHPEHRNQVDVVAIRFDVPEALELSCINELRQRQLKTLVGSPMFVLGFPFDPSATASSHYPIWKAATAASEPDLSPNVSRYMLVDTASRPGMSGAPVIQRAHGLAFEEFGDDGEHARPVTLSYPVTKLVGIYSGRLHTKSSLDAQLGLVWPKLLVDQILIGRQRDE